MHLVENKSEEADEELQKVSAFMVNVPVKRNGHKGVTLGMTIFSLSVLFVLLLAEPFSR
jgi:hypothetical protein